MRRINANKSAYMHYFIDHHKDKDPEIAKLKVSDLRESRLYLVDPAPIPEEELQRTYDWMKSWGFLETASRRDRPRQHQRADPRLRTRAERAGGHALTIRP